MTLGAGETVFAVAPMVSELGQALFTPPDVSAAYVSRPRLTDALRAGAAARLTLVEAPTGYGKTMLVAGWCAERQGHDGAPVGWLSLTAEDNDPARFARDLIGALQVAGPGVGERAAVMIGVPGGNPMLWIASLVEDLAAAASAMTLVLDDFHVLVDPVCQALVQFLIDQSSGSLQVIICTRAEPALGLGALRAAGDLVEIRAVDLRFDDQEAGELLVDREGLDLDRPTVASLTDRTEGWAAGLYLTVLWLRDQDEAAAQVERFVGDSRHVMDFLSAAVLEGLDEEVRWFLLATSIVDRVCPSLADAITLRSTEAVFRQVERSNAFLLPLEDGRTWYRYHHLFGQMLRSELLRRSPEMVTVLHRRVSEWCLNAGLVSEAVQHAIAARDFDFSVALICEYWLEVGRAGGDATVQAWLDAIDARSRRRYPELGFIGAVIVAASGGPISEFHDWIELAERGRSDAQIGARRVAGTTTLRAGIDYLHAMFESRDIASALFIGARSARTESETDGDFRLVALANLGLLRYLAGDPAGADQAVRQTLRDPQVHRRPHGYMVALSTLALISLDTGDLVEGERIARRALDYASAWALSGIPVSSLAHVALGRALAGTGRAELAAESMHCALSLLRGSAHPAWLAYALVQAAAVQAGASDVPGATGLVLEARLLLESFGDAGILSSLLREVEQTVRAEEPVAPHALTRAELDVLRLMPGGLSRRAMADVLSVSMNTVKTHTSAIYRKLGVDSRADAVTRAIELSLL